MHADVPIYSVPPPPVNVAKPAAEIRRDDRPGTIKVRIPYDTALPREAPHPIDVPETSVLTSATSTHVVVIVVPPKDSESNKIIQEQRIVFYVSARPPGL